MDCGLFVTGKCKWRTHPKLIEFFINGCLEHGRGRNPAWKEPFWFEAQGIAQAVKVLTGRAASHRLKGIPSEIVLCIQQPAVERLLPVWQDSMNRNLRYEAHESPGQRSFLVYTQ